MQLKSKPEIKKLYIKIKKTAAELENLLNQITRKIAVEKAKEKKLKKLKAGKKTKKVRRVTVTRRNKMVKRGRRSRKK